MSEWINDAIYYCEQCDMKFKVYAENDEPVVNFCPSCASRKFDVIEPEED